MAGRPLTRTLNTMWPVDRSRVHSTLCGRSTAHAYIYSHSLNYPTSIGLRLHFRTMFINQPFPYVIVTCLQPPQIPKTNSSPSDTHTPPNRCKEFPAPSTNLSQNGLPYTPVHRAPFPYSPQKIPSIFRVTLITP